MKRFCMTVLFSALILFLILSPALPHAARAAEACPENGCLLTLDGKEYVLYNGSMYANNAENGCLSLYFTHYGFDKRQLPALFVENPASTQLHLSLSLTGDTLAAGRVYTEYGTAGYYLSDAPNDKLFEQLSFNEIDGLTDITSPGEYKLTYTVTETARGFWRIEGEIVSLFLPCGKATETLSWDQSKTYEASLRFNLEFEYGDEASNTSADGQFLALLTGDKLASATPHDKASAAAAAPAPTTAPAMTTVRTDKFELSSYLQSIGISKRLSEDFPFYQYSGEITSVSKSKFKEALSALRAYGLPEKCITDTTDYYYEGEYQFTDSTVDINLHYYEALDKMFVEAAYRRAYSYPKGAYDPALFWLPDVEKTICGDYDWLAITNKYTQTGGTLRFQAQNDRDALAQTLDYIRQYQLTETRNDDTHYTFTADGFRLTLEVGSFAWIKLELLNTRTASGASSGRAAYGASFVSCEVRPEGITLVLDLTETGKTGGSVPLADFCLAADEAGHIALSGCTPTRALNAQGEALAGDIPLRAQETARVTLFFPYAASAGGFTVDGAYFWLDTCAQCQGDGDCHHCVGGRCAYCGGSGYKTSGMRCVCIDGKCTYCGGNGRCWYCKGKGRKEQ